MADAAFVRDRLRGGRYVHAATRHAARVTDAGEVGQGHPTRAVQLRAEVGRFRSIIFRDGDEVEIGSRNERPMTRYFPSWVDAIKANTPDKCVLDGEIILIDPSGMRLDFEALQQRIHPAASRVNMLAEQTRPVTSRSICLPRASRPHGAAVRRAPRGPLGKETACWQKVAPPTHLYTPPNQPKPKAHAEP